MDHESAIKYHYYKKSLGCRETPHGFQQPPIISMLQTKAQSNQFANDINPSVPWSATVILPCV